MPGKLFIVPTPVGNLGDMTPRAVEVLREASLILAEDTRTSAVLMKHFGIATPMASHHKYNEHQPLDPILDRIEAGEYSLGIRCRYPRYFRPRFFAFSGVSSTWSACRNVAGAYGFRAGTGQFGAAVR